MPTLDEFIAANNLVVDVERASDNPNMERDDWSRTARHWRVTIKSADNDAESLQVPFSQGSAHTEPPTLADVLDCVSSDAAGVENAQGFDDWASELGFFPMESSEDYKRAMAAWEAIQRQTGELRALLGDEATEALLWDTDGALSRHVQIR